MDTEVQSTTNQKEKKKIKIKKMTEMIIHPKIYF